MGLAGPAAQQVDVLDQEPPDGFEGRCQSFREPVQRQQCGRRRGPGESVPWIESARHPCPFEGEIGPRFSDLTGKVASSADDVVAVAGGFREARLLGEELSRLLQAAPVVPAEPRRDLPRPSWPARIGLAPAGASPALGQAVLPQLLGVEILDPLPSDVRADALRLQCVAPEGDPVLRPRIGRLGLPGDPQELLPGIGRPEPAFLDPRRQGRGEPREPLGDLGRELGTCSLPGKSPQAVDPVPAVMPGHVRRQRAEAPPLGEQRPVFLVPRQGEPGPAFRVAGRPLGERAQEGALLGEVRSQRPRRLRQAGLEGDEVRRPDPGRDHQRRAAEGGVEGRLAPAALDPAGQRGVHRPGEPLLLPAEAVEPVEKYPRGLVDVQVAEVGSPQQEVLQGAVRLGLEAAQPGGHPPSRENLIEVERDHEKRSPSVSSA